MAVNAVHKPVVETPPSLLVVDDDESMRDILLAILRRDYDVHLASNLNEARQILQNFEIQVVLLDVRLNQEDGLTLLPEIKEMNEQIEVIVITVITDVKTAVHAMKAGAYDYINKEFNPEDLRAIISRVLEKQRAMKELLYLREEVRQSAPDALLIGRSPAMLAVKEMADRAAPIPTTVLITGETGTGKELIARYIHRKSHLADKPFVTVNLAAIPSELMESILFGHEKGSFTGAHRLHYGKFELANGGTLFLDEIGELRYDLQAKLLRAIQENEIERIGGNRLIPVKVRLIAATNANLLEKIKNRQFREDLYYRLNVVPIHVPPLRERIEDLSKLTELFLDRYNKKFNRRVKGFKPEIFEILATYDWPGNIRELENFVERIVAITNKEYVGFTDIPLEYQLHKVEKTEVQEGEELLQKTLDAFEKSFILRVLEEEEWNQTQAAKRLGIHRKTLEYKVKRLNLGEMIALERKKGD
ncbi:MAG TPA: sigma-54 dependent transcriptional regulator [bacterium]|nr:sigma-54 dependent transcriptional regulator [bacterium]